MSTLSEILDRLSGIATLRERVTETSRHVDKALAWLLDHEKRLIQLEAAQGRVALAAPQAVARPRLPKKQARPDAQP